MRLFLLSICFICSNLISDELVFTCENYYSYKLVNLENAQKSYFKYKKDNWTEIKSFNISGKNLELFIPNMKYLACSDESLTVCKYSIRINDFKSKRPTVNEVVLNDCYIGTMGCNEYKKGLELNQSFCKLN